MSGIYNRRNEASRDSLFGQPLTNNEPCWKAVLLRRTGKKDIIMFKKAILASAALALCVTPVAAQAAQAAAVRSGADVEQADQLRGAKLWIVAAIALGLIIWGIIELTDDEEPDSP
jgi:hypothetical protein